MQQPNRLCSKSWFAWFRNKLFGWWNQSFNNYVQNNLSFLYLSNVGSLPPMPSWFWSKLQTLVSMTISNNNLTGRIPNLELNLTNYPEIDLSSNQLEGAFPSFLLQASALHLSNNKISDLASFLCSKSKPNNLGVLDLSNNQLNGELPDCLNNLSSLQFIDLSNNKLTGNIPDECTLILILRNNSLTGQITPPWKIAQKTWLFWTLEKICFMVYYLRGLETVYTS